MMRCSLGAVMLMAPIVAVGAVWTEPLPAPAEDAAVKPNVPVREYILKRHLFGIRKFPIGNIMAMAQRLPA